MISNSIAAVSELEFFRTGDSSPRKSPKKMDSARIHVLDRTATVYKQDHLGHDVEEIALIVEQPFHILLYFIHFARDLVFLDMLYPGNMLVGVNPSVC